MKKLLIMAFAVLTVSTFAADKTTETTVNAVESKGIEATHIFESKNISNVQVQQAPSLGDSFMAAFGMSEGNVGGQQGSSSSSSSSSTAATGSAASVGAVSAAVNSASVNVSNSTTIITPYGKY